MLDVAIRHKDELVDKFRSVWFDEKYKFWNCSNFYEEWEVSASTQGRHQFVSLDNNDEVIGYMGYGIDRANDCVYALNIINFTDDKVTFGLDCGQAIKDIFEKFHFRKLCFSVVVGNPIEKSYDKIIRKYGGRVVGTQKAHVKLIDGLLYDEKLYEVLEEDYRERKLQI